MQGDNKGLNLRTYWPFWGLHFGIHMIIGFFVSIGGILVICTQSEVLNGLALVGAGSFAMINGWQGFVELGNKDANGLYKTQKENNQ